MVTEKHQILCTYIHRVQGHGYTLRDSVFVYAYGGTYVS